ncbi:Uncharacterised protein [[Clostridium] sordellii]|uniref:hypothetical protein n=1 Tax=Paraclostridium sordellii TaxID=1505 RepID=UPI0005DD9ABB|nr:hypothetical protein [Paeniclostridium sordellii]CEO06693.1 Uncharacterised protein [[Clostridium] sordellii] [Paeniclostridium sordellii]
MEPWNYLYIFLGLSYILGIFIRSKVTSYYKNILEKLELKYGDIDRKKAIKLEKFYDYLTSGIFLFIGIFIRNCVFAFKTILLILIVNTIVYYLVRRKYLLTNN